MPGASKILFALMKKNACDFRKHGLEPLQRHNARGELQQMATADFTIADVLAWARTKPADERYDYQDRFGCALCHFLRDTRRARAPVVSSYLYEGTLGGWRDDSEPDTAKRPYEEALDEAVSAGVLNYNLGRTHPDWTFGALVKRLEALCPPSEWTKADAYMLESVPA